MSETDQIYRDSKDEFAEAQLQKVKLEVQNLKNNVNKRKGIAEYIGPYLPLLTALIAVGGFIFGIITFNAQQQRDNQIKEKEFKRVFWEKQLALYAEVTQLTGKVATTSDEAERKKLYEKLSSHFHGDLIVVADKEVMESVIEFIAMYESFVSEPTLQEELKAASRKLARACRKSLVDTFGVQLGDFRDYKEVERSK
jgi:hypothetical protein